MRKLISEFRDDPYKIIAIFLFGVTLFLSWYTLELKKELNDKDCAIHNIR